jgi:hypothetical protein
MNSVFVNAAQRSRRRGWWIQHLELKGQSGTAPGAPKFIAE